MIGMTIKVGLGFATALLTLYTLTVYTSNVLRTACWSWIGDFDPGNKNLITFHFPSSNNIPIFSLHLTFLQRYDNLVIHIGRTTSGGWREQSENMYPGPRWELGPLPALCRAYTRVRDE